jgi:hypothetical protein
MARFRGRYRLYHGLPSYRRKPENSGALKSATNRKAGGRRTYQFFVEHVICRAGNPGVIQTALVNEFKEVVHTGEDVVHEDYGIEILVLGVSLLVKGHKSSIANFCEILDTVVKRSTCALRCTDGNTKSDRAGQSVENAEKCLCLVCGAVLIDGDKDIVVTKDG